jgi:hypothetical protein
MTSMLTEPEMLTSETERPSTWTVWVAGLIIVVGLTAGWAMVRFLSPEPGPAPVAASDLFPFTAPAAAEPVTAQDAAASSTNVVEGWGEAPAEVVSDLDLMLTEVDPSITSPTRVVEPEEKVDLGAGRSLWLTRDGKWFAPTWMPEGQFKSAGDGNQAIGTVSKQGNADDAGYVLTGIYMGSDVRAILVNGEPAQVVRLAGKPGWVAYWFTGGDGLVQVVDRSGAVVAAI